MLSVALGGRLAQQAWVQPWHPQLVRLVGSDAACRKSPAPCHCHCHCHSRPRRRPGEQCCLGSWSPWRGPGTAVAHLLGAGRNCASAGRIDSAAGRWEGWRCGWHMCRWLCWSPCCHLLPDHGSRRDAERVSHCVVQRLLLSGLIRVSDADDLCQVEVQLRLHYYSRTFRTISVDAADMIAT